MSKSGWSIAYVIAMIATVILIDISFFKNHTAERFAANVGIILLYIAFYYRFMKRS